jgi:oligopeptidase B
MTVNAAAQLKPPVAKQVPKALKAFGDVRQDPYFWMRHKEDPAVLQHIQAENAYTAGIMKPVQPLVDKVYQDMLGRIKQTDLSAPYRIGGHFYYRRTEEGKQYFTLARKKGSLEAAEEILLDVNEMAKPHQYFRLGPLDVSPEGQLLAYSTDVSGYNEFTLRVRDLKTGTDLPDQVERINQVLWTEDGETLLYVRQQPQTKRPYQVWLHRLRTAAAADQLIYEEPDERFEVEIGKSLSKKYLFIEISSGETREIRYAEATKPLSGFVPFLPRRTGILYSLAHQGGRFFLRINDQGRDFRVVTVPESDTAETNWREVIPAQPGLFVEDMLVLENHAAYLLRLRGLHALRIINLQTGHSHDVNFDEPAYALGLDVNREFFTNTIRFHYSSMVTPRTIYDYDADKRERTVVKRQEVLGGYDPSQYALERIEATSHDGVKVPITIAYKKGFLKNGKAPLLLYGYGAYSIPMDPDFSSERLALLDRGVAYAIAHIRGGTELGHTWYEAGKLLKKKNSFRDFLASAEHLIAGKYTAPDRLVIEGRSAGGLLMGAVMNARPDLFKTVLAGVPFVDVVSSLQDKSIPLSATDADEFGDPDQQQFYEYQKSYSPYDNVVPAKYPNLYVQAGFNDSQVAFWEPVKWIAKLRENQKGTGLLLLDMNMEAGHGGASGRYDRLKEVAKGYAFALWTLGIKE